MARSAGIDLGRLAELQNLVAALYQALSEPRGADSRSPLLALSPLPVAPGAAAPATTSPSGAAAPPVAWASAGVGYAASPDWVDPSAATIAAIERRLEQQVRLNRSPPEIAQTQFALAQALWNSSDAEDQQARALALARQSKAALDAVPAEDSTVLELRQQVNDWLTLREGPAYKPTRGGGLLRGRAESLDPSL